MYYPPVDVEKENPRFYWLCPECYKLRIEKLEWWMKEGYYYFRDIGTTATLEQLGFKDLDEYMKSLD
ncbi:MAG: hypothetical protein JSV62_07440 [Promethearchaeota archaeon]|nr:MAG: hypothetical protein JSV62_07440 [Candidatus Lokiarchaeota archaeon]